MFCDLDICHSFDIWNLIFGLPSNILRVLRSQRKDKEG